MTQAFFERIARRYDRAYAPDARVSRERMARVVAALPPGAKVLDLGVGTGRELSALLDAGLEPVGVDASPTMLELCARRARPVPLVETDFYERLPFPDASFGAAIALHGTLAHPPDDAALVDLARELARVVAPGGVLYVEMPSRAWLDCVPAVVESEGRRLARTAPDRFRYEDLVVGVCIEARVPSDEEWRALFDPAFDVRVEPLGSDEIAILGRRAPARSRP
jgi:ubiquinone/menaquinone biosynthesis C-methylase UbiE